MSFTLTTMLRPQEVGGAVIGENRLVVRTGAESLEWYPGV